MEINYNDDRLAEQVTDLLRMHNKGYFHLSEDEIRSFAQLAVSGETIPDESAITLLAHLTNSTEDPQIYWAAIESYSGIIHRNSIKNDEDIERKERLIALFNSQVIDRPQFISKVLPYNTLVKAILCNAETHPKGAPAMAFGLYKEMSGDYLFLGDLRD